VFRFKCFGCVVDLARRPSTSPSMRPPPGASEDGHEDGHEDCHEAGHEEGHDDGHEDGHEGRRIPRRRQTSSRRRAQSPIRAQFKNNCLSEMWSGSEEGS